MRILPLLTFLFISANVFAVEPVDEQQVMFYYQIPIGADKQHSKHEFGLRFDQTSHDPREDVRINALQSKPAAMDFRMGYDGVKAIDIHGVDYAKYFIARAAEGEDTPPAGGDEPAADTSTGNGEDTSAETTSESAQTASDQDKKEPGQISSMISNAPVGVGIGVIIGLVILAGGG